MKHQSRARSDKFPCSALFLAWLAVTGILFLSGVDRLVQRQFPDPDDILRLVQVRDLIAGQGWFDTTQYRIDPPAGTPMHWSRLVDAPIFLIITLLMPLLGQGSAELAALVVVPLLTFALTSAVVGRLAWRLLGSRVAIFAVLVCGFLPTLLFQFRPMRLDHHGWQIFAVILALWAISWRNEQKGGWVAGLAMATGLSVSLEILPIAAAFGGVLFGRWWNGPTARRWLLSFMQALSGGLVLLYLGTRSTSLIEYCDAISPAHIAFFLVACAGTWVASKATKPHAISLILIFAIVGVTAFATFAIISPACMATPFARLDPAVDEFWYRRVLEGQPIWLQTPSYYVPALIQMAAAVGAAIALRMRSQGWMRRWWTDYLLLLLAAVALSLFVSRSIALASVIAAIPLGWLASELLLKFRSATSPVLRVGVIVSFLLLLAPVTPFTLLSMIEPTDEDRAFRQANLGEASCRVREQVPLLNAIPPALIFTPLDIGPSVLLGSHHSVVATGHHRAERAMADVINAFVGTPGNAEKIVKSRGAEYLALCTDLTETLLYSRGSPNGLTALLVQNDVPDWLEPINLGQSEEFAVFRVVD